MLYEKSASWLRTILFLVLFTNVTLVGYARAVLAEDSTKPPAGEPTASVDNPASPPVENAAVDPSMMLRGAVWRTKPGIVFLKTPVGLLTLSSKTTLKDLKASQEVTFWIHERQMVVEIRRKADGGLVHRYLTGPMTPGTEAKTLQCWAPQGAVTVHYGTQEERLAAVHEGEQLTVEIDESQTIIGLHDLQFDLQIGQLPPSGSDAYVLLSGTVSKLKSNFVFLRTPVGVVMANTKIGLPPLKVGQPVTLRIDRAKLTVNLAAAKPAAPRPSVPLQPPVSSPAPVPPPSGTAPMP